MPMPRPPKPFSRSINRRTRTGCQTCRQRKIKCDEGKPTCDQCRAKGLECITTAALKWEAEYVSKGLKFGRAGVWSKDPLQTASPSSTVDTPSDLAIWCSLPEVHPYSFVNITVDSIEALSTLDLVTQPHRSRHVSPLTDEGEEVASESFARASSLSPWLTSRMVVKPISAITPPPTFLPQFKREEGLEASSLLSYYMEKVCPMTISSFSSMSPFASLLVPFSVNTSALAMDAVLALAACHRSRSDQGYQARALLLSHRALQSLRTKLRSFDPRTVAMDLETLVVMLLLCMFEIVNECDERWVVHLKGARDLIRLRRENTSTLSKSFEEMQLSLFCERFFAFQDVIGRTACGEDPVFGTDFWEADSTDCDPSLGCSPELISILSEITELGLQDLASRQSMEFQTATATLEARLASLEQRVWDTDDTVLTQSAELKRLAAELYLQCALNGADPSLPWVAEQVCKILRLIAVLLDSQLVSGISWPLFVAAVELDSDYDFQSSSYYGDAPRYARPFVLYALEKLAGSMVNVRRTRSVIEKVWQTRELEEMSGPEGDIEHNDWEHFIAPLCGNMSLA